MELTETQFAARLRLGGAGDLIGELESAVATYPYQEGLWELLITALYRAGRQADALATYQRVRTLLADELGLAPGPRLQELERQILVHDSALGIGDRAARALEDHARAGNLPSLVGRARRPRDGDRRRVGPARRPAAGRDRRTGRDREDRRRDRHRSPAGRVGWCRARWDLVGQARNRDDRGRRPRHGDRRAPRHGRRGGAARAAQGLRRGGDPRQLRARARRCRGARGPPARRRPAAADPVHQPGARSTSTARPCSSSRPSRSPRPWSCSPAEPPHATGICPPARPTTRCTTCAARSTACRWRSSSPRHARRRLSIEEISRRLDDRFSVLSDPTSRRPERRRALKATIQWSYELLFPDDQRGLWALATFAGGAPLPAVEFVLEALDVPASAAIDVVGRLASRSLVIVDDEGPVVRYRLLDSIRAFALDAMAEAGLTERALAAHAAWFADAAGSSTQGVRSSRQAEHLAFARAERANIDAALAWSADARPAARARGSSTGSAGRGSSSATAEAHNGSWRHSMPPATPPRSGTGPARSCSRPGSKRRRVDLELAREHIAAATELADAIDDVDLQARCCYYLAYVVSHHGECGSGDGADRSQQRALRRAGPTVGSGRELALRRQSRHLRR